MKNLKKWMTVGIDSLCTILGSAVYAVAFILFFDPNHISPGGVTGLAAVLGHAANTPVGLTALLLNIPLLIAGVRAFGFKFMALTGLGTVCSALFLDLFSPILAPYTGERIMAALAGGVFAGLGLGLVMLRGASTGGTDIAAKLIQRKKPHFSVGRMLLVLDAAVVAIAALYYREFESALYSVLAIFISSKMIDSILYGADRGEIFYIITRESQAVTQRILQEVERGVSKIQILGGYTNQPQEMLMCVVRPNQIAKIRGIVTQCDPSAFVIMAPAGEILGPGFKALH